MLLGTEPTLDDHVRASIEVQILSMQRLADDDRFAKLQAKVARNYYNALIDAGFLKSEALGIVANSKA